MERTINASGVIVCKLDMSIAEDRKAKDTIKKARYFYNRNTCEWNVYGFDSVERFDKFIVAGINGDSINKRGIKPTKTALKEQQKAFWNSEEGKAIKEKRRNWVKEQNKKKFEYIQGKWDFATATVLEEVCANDKKLSYYKLSDTEVDNMAKEYQDKIADLFTENMFGEPIELGGNN